MSEVHLQVLAEQEAIKQGFLGSFFGCSGASTVAMQVCRHTSLMRPIGPYRRPMPRVLGGVLGGGCCGASTVAVQVYMDTSLIRKRRPLGPYGRTMPRVLGGS